MKKPVSQLIKEAREAITEAREDIADVREIYGETGPGNDGMILAITRLVEALEEMMR